MTTKSNDPIVTVVTCEGDLQDPTFPVQLQGLVNGLKKILGTTAEHKAFRVTKLEPWNSVRVTFQIPREAAQRLRQLAQQGDRVLRELGILSVQIEGDQVISLTIAGRYSQPQEIVLTTESDGRANSGTPSLDLSGSEGSPGPSNVETTRKNIAQYLSQQGATAAVATMTVVGSTAPPAVASTSSTGSSSDFFHGASDASSQFKSPNVVAPGGEPIPFPARHGAVPSRTPGAFGPFPFASMTHAAINTMHGSHHQGQGTPSTAASTSPAPSPSPSPSTSGMSPRFPFSSPPPPYPGSSAASTAASVGLNPLHQPQPPPIVGIPAAGHQPPTGSYGQPPTSSSATVNNLPRGGSGPNVALSSPLLVNLLQSDLAGSAPPSQHLNKLFPPPAGHPHQQDGVPVKRKRKPRRPKDRPGEAAAPSSASPAASPLMSPLSPATLSLTSTTTTTGTSKADLGYSLSSSKPAFSISLPVLPSIPLSPPIASPVPSVSAPQTATNASSDGSSQEKELSPWPSPSKRTQHLINPFTGQLEPMPTDDEDEDETLNNLVLEDNNSNPCEKESSVKSESDKANERLNVPSESTKEVVGKVVIPVVKEETNPASVAMKDSPQSGVGSPGEKIKLRLKLEPKGREVSKDGKEKESNVDRLTGRSAVYVEKQKAENMSAGTVQYKVDVSFVNIPTVKKTSALGSSFGGSSTSTTSSSSEPRVPPLHISLRGRNAMVVGSLRKEEKGMQQLHSKDAHSTSETDAGRRLETNAIPVSMRSQRSKSPRNSRLSESGVGRRGSGKSEGGRRSRGLINTASNPLSSVPSAAIPTAEPTVVTSVAETSSLEATSSPPPTSASKDGERGAAAPVGALPGLREKALLSGGGIVLASLRGAASAASATTSAMTPSSTAPTKVSGTAQGSMQPTPCVAIRSSRGESDSANTKLPETAESRLFKEVHRTVEPVAATATSEENATPAAEGKITSTVKAVAGCPAETLLPSTASVKETNMSVSSTVDSVMHVKGVSVVMVEPQPVTMEAVVVVKPCVEVSSAIVNEGSVPSSLQRDVPREDRATTSSAHREVTENVSLPVERRPVTSSEGDRLSGESVTISALDAGSSNPSKLDTEISESKPSRAVALPLPSVLASAAAASLPYSAQVSFLRVPCSSSRDGAIAKQPESGLGTSSDVPQTVEAATALAGSESRQSNIPTPACSNRTNVPVVGESRWNDALTNSESPSAAQYSNMQRYKAVADSTTPVRKGGSAVLPVTPESLQRLRTVASSALAGVRSSTLASRQLCAPTPTLDASSAAETLQHVAVCDVEDSRLAESLKDVDSKSVGETVAVCDASKDLNVVGVCVVTPAEKVSLVVDERTLGSASVSLTSANHCPAEEVGKETPVQRVCRERQKDFIPNASSDIATIGALENSWHDGQLLNTHRKLSNHSSLEQESHVDSPLPPSPLLHAPASPPLIASTKVVEVPSLEVDPAFTKVKMASPAVTSGFPSLIPSHGDHVVVRHINSLEEMDQATEAEFLDRAASAVTGKGLRLPAAAVHLNSTLRTLSSNTAAAVCNFVVPASAGANTVYRNHASETVVSLSSLMKGEGDTGCAPTAGSNVAYHVDRYAIALRDDRALGASKDSSSSSSGSSPNEDSGIDSMDALSEKQSESEVESSRSREDRSVPMTEAITSTVSTNATVAASASPGQDVVLVCADQLSQLHRTAATPPNLPSPIGGGGDGGGCKDADEDGDASTHSLAEDVIISVQLQEGEDGESSHVYLVESSGEPCLEEHVAIDGETSTMHIYVATDAEDASRAEQLISNLEGVEGPVTAVVLAESSFADGEGTVGLFEAHIDNYGNVVSGSVDEESFNADGRKSELCAEDVNDQLPEGDEKEKSNIRVDPSMDTEEDKDNNDTIQSEPVDTEGNDNVESSGGTKNSDSTELAEESSQKPDTSPALEQDGMARPSIISSGPPVDDPTQPAGDRQVSLPASRISSLPSGGTAPTSHVLLQGLTPTTTVLGPTAIPQVQPRTKPNSFVTSVSNSVHSSFIPRSLAPSSSSVHTTYTSSVSTTSVSSILSASSPVTVPIKLVTLPTLVSPSVRLDPGITIPSEHLSPSSPSTPPPMKIVVPKVSSPVVTVGSVVVKSVVVTNTSPSLKTVHPHVAIETVSVSSNLSPRISPLTTAGTAVLRIAQPPSPTSLSRILPSSDDYVTFPGVKSIQLPSPIQHTCFVTREPVKTSLETVTTTSDPVVTIAGPPLLVTSSSGLSSSLTTTVASAGVPLLSRWSAGFHGSGLPVSNIPMSNGSPSSSHVSPSLTTRLTPEMEEKPALLPDTIPATHYSKGTTPSIGSCSPPSDDLLSPPPDVSPSDGESYGFCSDRDNLLESSVATGDHNYVYRVMRPVDREIPARTVMPVGNHHETDSSREGLEASVLSSSPASYDLKLECPEDALGPEQNVRESVAGKPDTEPNVIIPDAAVTDNHAENGDPTSSPLASVAVGTGEGAVGVKVETQATYARNAIGNEDLEQLDMPDHEVSLCGLNVEEEAGFDSATPKNENLTSNALLLDSPSSTEPEERRWMRSMRSNVRHAPMSPCKTDGPQENHVTTSDDDSSVLVNSDNHNDPDAINTVDHSVPLPVINSFGGSKSCKRRREDSGSDAEHRRDIGMEDGDENALQPKSPGENENLLVPFYTKPVKRRCSENAAELIKACMGVEDTPKRASITKHRSSSTEDSCTPPEKGRMNDSRSGKTEDEMAKSSNRYYKGRREDGRRGRAGSQVSLGVSGESSDDELTLSELASKNKVSKQSRRPPTPVADEKNATRHSKQRHKGQEEDGRRPESSLPVPNSRHNSRGREESSKSIGRGLREPRRDLRRGGNHPTAGTHSSVGGHEELNMREDKVSSHHLTRGSRSSERSRRSPPRARDKSPVRGGHSRGRGKDNDRSSPIHHSREDETATKRKTRSSGTSEYYDSLPTKRRRYSREHR